MKQEKGLLSSIILGFFVCVVFSLHANAYIMANYSESIFTTFGNREAVPEIKTDIIESADYFLKSYSDFLNFLSRIERTEMDGIDYSELTALFHSCVSNLRNSKEVYRDLLVKTELTPYNDDVIKKLRRFHYKAFRVKNSLNPAVFKEVSVYLRKADIRGLYKQLFADLEEILANSVEISKQLKENRFPKITGLWELNSLFSKTLIFGQYAAMIFHKIMTNR